VGADVSSRFDLFFVIVDEMGEVSDRQLAQFMVDVHTDATETLGRVQKVTREELLTFLRVARRVKPVITNSARLRIIKYCLTLSRSSTPPFFQALQVPQAE
jgi:DNA replicative helicase MCM subunit Mcm2 (Cdc46/Mcm family)